MQARRSITAGLALFTVLLVGAAITVPAWDGGVPAGDPAVDGPPQAASRQAEPAIAPQYQLGARLPDDYPLRLEEIRRRRPAYPLIDLPSSFDWCDSGFVSPVRQQLCGDCWAQCSVGAMESVLRRLDGNYTMLSVQQAVDCNFGGSTCGGGWVDDTYNLYRSVGAVSQDCFPYRGEDGSCDHDPCDIVAIMDGYEYIDTTVVSLKTHVLTHGPLAVAFAVFSDFYAYAGGCYEHEGTGVSNHGILLVGWDDALCGGAGAWRIKNSWGTDWGDSGFAWIKYGTCNIGEGATIIHYAPVSPVALVHDSHSIDDPTGDGDGRPDPGETVTLDIGAINEGRYTATGVSATLMSSTSGINITVGSASFPDIEPDSARTSDPPHFSFSVDPSLLCGARANFALSLTSDQGICTDVFSIPIGDVEIVLSYDVEDDLGWSLVAPDDDFTTGRWRRKNPIGSFDDSLLVLVQPELDHSPDSLVRCFVTSNILRILDPTSADVDGGKTTLTSPALDMSPYASARLSYWRWYSNDTGDPPDDSWNVDGSADSGLTWTGLESTTASDRSWIPVEVDLGDLGLLTDEVLLRFVASDYGTESIVEAAVDDIEITACPYSVDTAPPTVALTVPNGGEELTENSTCEIRWSADDDYGIRQALVLASYDGGAGYNDTVGVAGALDSLLVWQVPSGEHPACKIRVEVTDRGYNTAFDESDSTFSIVLDVSGVARDVPEVWPRGVELLGSRVNPFTGSTHICFGVPARMQVKVQIFDVQGRLVAAILDGTVDEGYHTVIWSGGSASGRPASPGTYFIHLEAGNNRRTAKAVLAR